MNTHYINKNILATGESLIRSIYADAPTTLPQINLGLGELSYPVPEQIKSALKNAIDEEGTNRYTSNAGLLQLRTAIAKDCNNSIHTKFDAKNVIVTTGSTEALFISFFTFATKKSVVLLPEIGYPAYEGDAQLLGLRVKKYRLRKDFSIDVEHLLSLLTKDSTCLIVLNSPSNPTGNVIDRETLEELFEKIKDRSNIHFLSDEVYSCFVYDNRQHASIASYLPARTIIINGVSKRASITGYRLGWMIADASVISHAIKAHAFFVTAASSLIQYGVLPVLHGACDEETIQFRADLERKREIMIRELQNIPHIKVTRPQGAFYCFIDVSHYGLSLNIARKILKETGVVTTPGLAFGKAADQYIRLSFAADEQAIIDGIQKMKGVFATWKV